MRSLRTDQNTTPHIKRRENQRDTQLSVLEDTGFGEKGRKHRARPQYSGFGDLKLLYVRHDSGAFPKLFLCL
jgi:hypothetical protein